MSWNPSRSRRLLGAAFVIGVQWPLSALAYRPFNGTDAAVAAKGEVELELGPLGFIDEGLDRSLVAPSAVANWGVARRAELVLEGRHVVQLGNRIREPRFRLEDTALSLKTVMREGTLQEKRGVSVAAELSALLPTLHAGPGAGCEVALIASRRWPDLTLHLNGAVAWTRAHRPGLFASAIAEVHDAWAVRPVAEAFVEAERDEPTTVSGLLGAIWRARNALSFDAGLRFARAGRAETFEVRAGLTWSFDARFPR